MLRPGDLVFQESPLLQHREIGWISNSHINNCGIIIRDNKKFYVMEAANAVHKIPFREWLKRGRIKAFIIARWRNLSAAGSLKVRKTALAYLGRLYDWNLEWDESKIYGAELVRKVFESAEGTYLGDISVFDPRVLKPALRDSLQKYNPELLRRKEIVTPEAILQDAELEVVFNSF